MSKPLSFSLKKYRSIRADLSMIDKETLAETNVKPDAGDQSGSDLPANRDSPRVFDLTSLIVLICLYKFKYKLNSASSSHI